MTHRQGRFNAWLLTGSAAGWAMPHFSVSRFRVSLLPERSSRVGQIRTKRDAFLGIAYLSSSTHKRS